MKVEKKKTVFRLIIVLRPADQPAFTLELLNET